MKIQGYTPEEYAAQFGCDPCYDKRPRIPGDGYLFYNFGSRKEFRTPEWLTRFLGAIDRTLRQKWEVKDKRGLLALRRQVAALQQIACLDEFTRGYITAALWASTDRKGCPLDDTYDPTDIHPDTLKDMIEDCTNFQRDHGLWLSEAYKRYVCREGTPREYAGHDFFLTRCGHGTGFWDRGLPRELGQSLTDAAKTYGDCYLDAYRGKVVCS